MLMCLEIDDIVVSLFIARIMSIAENHHLEFASSQMALTSRSLKNLMDILLMHLNFMSYKDNKYSNILLSLILNICLIIED